MKTLLLTTIFATQLFGNCFAGLGVLPEIPIPKLTATQALAIAQHHMTNFTNYTLVAIEWCNSTTFQPRFSDGTHYTPANDHPNEYSWFVTYVYKEEVIDKLDSEMGLNRHRRFNSVLVERIKDDGQIGILIGTR